MERYLKYWVGSAIFVIPIAVAVSQYLAPESINVLKIAVIVVIWIGWYLATLPLAKKD